MCIHKASLIRTLISNNTCINLSDYDCPPSPFGGAAAKRPPLRLGRLLRQGGETHGSVRANVSASAGGLTAWAAVVDA